MNLINIRSYDTHSIKCNSIIIESGVMYTMPNIKYRTANHLKLNASSGKQRNQNKLISEIIGYNLDFMILYFRTFYTY